MKIKNIWLTAVFICLLPVLSQCDEGGYNKIGDVSVPDSMEVIKEGDVNVLVPKGGQLKQESSFLVKEVPDEYASRKFIAMEGYFNEIRMELEAQGKELKELREIVDRIAQEKIAK
ncbi:MAG: hypothetical protein Q8R38_01715 [Candidatus Omnitrophota bacterium]|nr:hypothetical protein [Candidatus Omnitrophota bacterium]